MSTRTDAARPRGGAFETLRIRIVDGYAERLLTGLSIAQPQPTRGLVRTRVLAILVALPVHLLSLASLVCGVWLVLPGHTWPERILGVVLLLLCYGVRPELEKRPPYVARLTARNAPATFGLVREIGALVGASTPDEILVTTRFRAEVSRAGLRTRALELGAPQWVAAGPQARVALIAHELGHLAHGDVTTGLWVGTARHTLDKWDHVLRPPGFRGAPVGTRRGFWGGGATVLVSSLVFPLLRAVVGAYSALMAWATGPVLRRQELMADLDAALVAGTDGALELFDTHLAELSVETAVASAAVDGRRPDLWTVVGERLAARGPQERARARENAASDRTRVDPTHPATSLRIKLIEARPRVPAAFVPEAGQWEAVDSELARPLAAAAKSLGERIRYQR